MKEEYKKLIMELLESLDEKALCNVYSFILGMVEAGKAVRNELQEADN